MTTYAVEVELTMVTATAVREKVPFETTGADSLYKTAAAFDDMVKVDWMNRKSKCWAFAVTCTPKELPLVAAMVMVDE